MTRLVGMCHAPLVLAIALSGCGRGPTSSSYERRAASVLFDDFETVSYARTNLLLRDPEGVSKEAFHTLLVPFGYLEAGLERLGKEGRADILANSEGVFVGAREFHAPTGFGPVRSRRCYVVILRNDRAVDLRKYFHSDPVEFAAEAPVWTWGADLGEFGEGDPRASVLYAALVGKTYMLVANGLDELRSVAEKLRSTTDENVRRGLEAIPHLESVSRYDLWGYRRYRHTGVADREAAGMSNVLPTADALMFHGDFVAKILVLRLLSASGDGATATGINTAALSPTLKPAGRGLWEAAIPIADNPKAAELAFLVVGMFGFATYL